YPVRVFALGDPATGFYRPVRAPCTIIPAPPALPTLEERVFASVTALADALAELAAGYPVMHAQDCISARAACRIRDLRPAGRPRRLRLRLTAGASGRPLILSVGGIEPRKGSDTLMRALAALRDSGRDPVLAIVGGHSFQDYRAYAERVLAMLPELGLRLGTD